MTEGTATPIVVIAILAETPGRRGMIVNAAPPSATQNPPRIPRAGRLGTPRASRRCEYQPAAIIAITLPSAGNAPNPDRALRKTKPFDEKRALPSERLRQARVRSRRVRVVADRGPDGQRTSAAE